MSAYIVEDKTINIIVGFLRRQFRNNHPSSMDIRIKGYDFNNDVEFLNLAHDMLKLNIRAVNCRYDKKTRFSAKNFDSYFTVANSPFQVVKSLNCWLYQCSEGKALNTRLFKQMEKMVLLICEKIVRDSPNYENANWG